MILTIYDTETSGKTPYDNDVHQFAYMLYDTVKQEIVRANSFYMWEDGYKWTQGAYEINGLSKEFLMANGSQNIQDKYKEIYVVMSRAREVGYNNDYYDRPLVEGFMSRFSIPPEPAQCSYDVMKIYKRARGKNYKLVNLCAELGFTPETIEQFTASVFKRENTKAHDAAYDVIATYLCLMKAKGDKYVSF